MKYPLIDSLAYIDSIPNEEIALDLIKQEMSAFSFDQSRMDELEIPTINQLSTQYPKLSQLTKDTVYTKLNAIDTNRFRLPTPSNEQSEQEWSKAVENAQAQLQHQESRLINLELLYKYGSDTWKLHNHHLEGALKNTTALLQEIQTQVIEINKDRRESQLENSGSLKSLSTKWMDLVLKLRTVELANLELSKEIQSCQESLA